MSDPVPVRKRRARRALGVAVLATVALYLVPFGHILGWPLVLFSTFVHEMGHGLTALLVGGSFDKLLIFADASGLAFHHGVAKGLPSALVAAGGLVGPALFAGMLFVVTRRARVSRISLVVFGVCALFAEVIWVRNPTGLIFVGAMSVGALLLARRGRIETVQTMMVFLAVQLSLSVFSRSDYLFVQNATVGGKLHVSDVGAIAQVLGGPFWLWGAGIGLFSVGVLALGSFFYLRAVTD